MAYENLLKSVEESALERERELQKNAKKQVDAIRSAAKEQAEEIQERTIQEAETSAAIERNKSCLSCKRRDQGAGPEKPGEGVRGSL